MLKGRLSKTSSWQFHKWLFGPKRFSGPREVGPWTGQDTIDLTHPWTRAFTQPTSRIVESSLQLKNSDHVTLFTVVVPKEKRAKRC